MMLRVYLYLLGFLTSNAAAAVTTPLVLPNTSEIASGTVANGLAVGNPDAQFNVEVSYEGYKIPLFSCLMNTVEFLLVLGLKDFWGSMPTESWKNNDYPEVGVVISPSREGGVIDRRFVIWGLRRGVTRMMHLNRFETATFTLLWQGWEMGKIELVAWPDATRTRSTQNLDQQPHQSFVIPSSDIPVFTKTTNITAENVQDPEVDVQITAFGLRLDLFTVFLLIFAVLVDAAAMGPTKRLEAYASPEDAAILQLVFETPTPAPTRSPYFEAGWLMMAAAIIPDYMIRRGVFREAFIKIHVDGVFVANGFLRPKVGLMNVNSNLSVS